MLWWGDVSFSGKTGRGRVSFYHLKFIELFFRTYTSLMGNLQEWTNRKNSKGDNMVWNNFKPVIQCKGTKKAFEGVSESQTLVLTEVFSLLEICWGYNKVGACSQEDFWRMLNIISSYRMNQLTHSWMWELGLDVVINISFARSDWNSGVQDTKGSENGERIKNLISADFNLFGKLIGRIP